MNNEYYRQYKQ